MIYIFKGFQSCCDIPAKCLNECGSIFDGACKGVCKPIGTCMSAACDALAGVCYRPLGCYAMLTIVMSTITLMASFLGVANMEFLLAEEASASNITGVPAVPVVPAAQAVGVCAKGTEVLGFTVIMGVFAVLNVFCALYVQHQVWETLIDLVEEEQDAPADKRGRRPEKNVATLIMDSSGRVFCYDICFCFYFFFLILEMVVAYYGNNLTDEAFCNPKGWPAMATETTYTYLILLVVFAFLWFIMIRCHSALENCCAPCGGFTCCFGRKPKPRDSGLSGFDSSDDEAYVVPKHRRPR